MTPCPLGRAFLCLLIVVAVVPSAWSQTPTVDPQTLIGQWSGAWVRTHEEKINGKYYLTVERVEGDKVFGKLELSGRTAWEGKIVGRLSGNQLTFGKTALTIDGSSMRGTGPDITITLAKEK